MGDIQSRLALLLVCFVIYLFLSWYLVKQGKRRWRELLIGLAAFMVVALVAGIGLAFLRAGA